MSGKTGIVASVLVVSALAAAVVQGDSFWHEYGWIMQADYRDDHAGMISTTQTSEIFDLLEDLKVGQKENQDEWKCDELDEEILDLELALFEVTTNAERVAVNRDIEKAKERWGNLNCQKFEDDQ